MMDNIEIDPNDPIHKRNFLLMLSPSEGQKISEDAGFSRPSEDVQEAETFDVVANWITLAAAGAMKYIGNASDWISEYVVGQAELLEEDKDDIKAAYYTYGVALISYLIQIGTIDLYSNGDVKGNMENFVDFLPNATVILLEESEDDE